MTLHQKSFIFQKVQKRMYAFEGYLLKNTKFERGSTGKHGFATLYREREMFIGIVIMVSDLLQ